MRELQLSKYVTIVVIVPQEYADSMRELWADVGLEKVTIIAMVHSLFKG